MILYNDRNYGQAIPEFQAAYDIIHLPRVLLSIADCHAALGRWQEAIDLFRRYLREAPSDPNPYQIEQKIALINGVQAEVGGVSQSRSGEVKTWLEGNATKEILLGGFFSGNLSAWPPRPLTTDWANHLIGNLPQNPEVRAAIQMAMVSILNRLNGTDLFSRTFGTLIPVGVIRAMTPTPPPAGAEPATSPAGAPGAPGVQATPTIRISFGNDGYFRNDRSGRAQPDVVQMNLNAPESSSVEIVVTGPAPLAPITITQQLRSGNNPVDIRYRAARIGRNAQGATAGHYRVVVRDRSSQTEIARGRFYIGNTDEVADAQRDDARQLLQSGIRRFIETSDDLRNLLPLGGRLELRFSIGSDRHPTNIQITATEIRAVRGGRFLYPGDNDYNRVITAIRTYLSRQVLAPAFGRTGENIEFPVLLDEGQ